MSSRIRRARLFSAIRVAATGSADPCSDGGVGTSSDKCRTLRTGNDRHVIEVCFVG
jgi:hypothetical protein